MSDDFNKVRFRVQVDGKPGGVVLVSGADLNLAWGRVDEGRRVW